jgi:hypothetical protein
MKLTLASLVLLWTSSASAFAPSFGSSFTQNRAATRLAPPSSSSTALQMNLFDRFTRVAKSNLNNILKNLEDPEKIMNQAVEDMQADLVKVRQSYAEITAMQRRMMKQKEQADALAQDWYNRAQLALKAGNKDWRVKHSVDDNNKWKRPRDCNNKLIHKRVQSTSYMKVCKRWKPKLWKVGPKRNKWWRVPERRSRRKR